MAGTASPPFELAPLARFLAQASGSANVEIGAFELLGGGAIQENWGFEAEFVGGTLAGDHRLVLRTNAATGVPSSLSRLEEFAVLRAVHFAGVTTPEPLFCCPDPGVIGKPFFVMRRLPGTALGRQITSDPALEPALPDLARRLGRELAQIQTIRPPRSELGFLPAIGPAEHIAGFRAYLDGYPQPRPVLEWAARWLETHRPEPLPPVLCHRDFRTGNYLVHGAELTGVLDWEFAGWGDPDEDIGWLCCKGWRFARLDREAGGIAERQPFYAGYETASGRRLDPRRIFYWEVLANVRWAIIALQQSDRYIRGGARDLSTAIIGRRATECELELLILLDAQGMPAQTCPPSGRGGDAFAGLRDLPSAAELLELGRALLIDDILPLLPPERHRDVHLVATAIGIAAREMQAGKGPAVDIFARLVELYAEPRAAEDSGTADLLARFTADLRSGAFEKSGPHEMQARAILWHMTVAKLREGNPQFLAANGFT